MDGGACHFWCESLVKKNFQHPFIPLRGFDKYPWVYTPRNRSLLCSPFSFKCCFRRRPTFWLQHRFECRLARRSRSEPAEGKNHGSLRMAIYLFQNMCFFGFHKKAFFFTLPNVRTNAEISRHLQLQLAIFEWFQCFKVPSFTHITGYGIPELPAGVKQLGKNLRNAARGRVESLRVWQGLGRVTHHRSCRNLYPATNLVWERSLRSVFFLIWNHRTENNWNTYSILEFVDVGDSRRRPAISIGRLSKCRSRCQNWYGFNSSLRPELRFMILMSKIQANAKNVNN